MNYVCKALRTVLGMFEVLGIPYSGRIDIGIAVVVQS